MRHLRRPALAAGLVAAAPVTAAACAPAHRSPAASPAASASKTGPYARSHESGRSVDVTVADGRLGTCPTRVQGHCLLAMGTGFDGFSGRAHAYPTDGVGAGARAHRAVLRGAMLAGGLAIYVGDWWHFDGPGADVGRPFLDAPLH